MPDPSIARLLIVDDESAQMKALCDTLEPEGYQTTGFSSPGAALKALRDGSFDLVISDLMMPEMDGIAFLGAALAIDPNLVGIVMTGQGTIGTAVQAMQTGALDYILKPFKLSAILPVISRALAVRRLRMENIQLSESVGIYQLSMAIAFATSRDSVLSQVAEAALKQPRVRAVSVLLPSSDGKDIFAALSLGEGAANVLGVQMPYQAALAGWIERVRELLDTRDEVSVAQLVSLAPLIGIPPGVSIPMLAGGRFVGILHVVTALRSDPPAPGWIKALNILATVCATALERVSLVDRLRTAEERYRRLAENAPDIVYRFDLQPRPAFAYVSPVVETITGYSDKEHYADPDLGFRIVNPGDRPLLENLLRGDYPDGEAVTMRYVHRDGSMIWLEHRAIPSRNHDGRVTAVEGIARDITERRRLEEQLRHAQKMEAIGMLAGGVAHDFNNQLTVINGYSNLLLTEDNLSADAVQGIEQIMKAGEHASALTRQLLAFGRRQALQPKVLDLNEIVGNTLTMLQRVIGGNIELAGVQDPHPVLIRIDPHQAGQILMNLALNARDAMPLGGRLTIETRDAGESVILLVSDTGSGMDAATQARVFEPFFTTKDPGKGTGLGLSIVYGAVKQSGGQIRILSELGKGTVFEIGFPRAEQSVSEPKAAVRQAGSAVGSETVLLVEDNPGVRQFVQSVLHTAGYTVLEASDGDEALGVSRRYQGRISLVLTDIVLPKMGGNELVERLNELMPGILTIYMSGYADQRVGGDRVGGDIDLPIQVPLLHKPFTSGTLLTMIRTLLDGGGLAQRTGKARGAG